MPQFQSTRPRGARPACMAGNVVRREVSIHAPAWGATCSPEPPAAACTALQSTRPRGARQEPRIYAEGSYRFQSTRPRGARRADEARGSDETRVSIHAPAWGATGNDVRSASGLAAFQSTRPRGARRRRHRRATAHDSSFNPRARVGRDLEQGAIGLDAALVSIHAPAWGATWRAVGSAA